MAKDGEPWLPACLSGLYEQTYSPLGIVAVDNGSTDRTREVLVKAVGEKRVLSLPAGSGLPAAVQAAVEREAAKAADYILVLHDDTALAPDAIQRMIEAAEGLEGVGIVGPKILDWDEPRLLREVGLSSDRFGHLYSPLEPREIDHGQYDRVREVLFVSSSAMLISKPAWQRAGLPDERLGSHHEDLDYCWRVRLAGFRVLMTPLGVARHRGAATRGERGDDDSLSKERYFAERAGLAAVLKNYGLLSLLWLLPAYAIQGLGKLITFLIARRFDDAYQLVSAWWWNVVHLPSTLKRRARAQSVRSVRDRDIHKYMAPEGFRLRRLVDVAGRIVPGDIEIPDEEEAGPIVPFRERAASAAQSHPVAAAWLSALVVGFVGYRHWFGPEVLSGGVLPVFPVGPGGFFKELASGFRTTLLGGSEAASPALGLLGGLSFILFKSTTLAQKVLLIGIVPLAGASMYRAMIEETKQRVPSIFAAACYALSPVALWSLSEGRIGLLVVIALMPRIAQRVSAAFGPNGPRRQLRFVVGTGAFLAVGIAFYPGTVLALAVLVGAAIFSRGMKRARGLGLSIGFTIAGLLLSFPLVFDIAMGFGRGLGSEIGRPDSWSLFRLSLGPGKGDWPIAWFLPAAALIGFAVARTEHRKTADRFLLSALAGSALAWASAAGYLPGPLANAPAYVVVAAVSYAGLVGIGLAGLFGKERQRFGFREVVVALMVALVAGGLGLQGVSAAAGGWEVRPDGLPAAWPVVESGATGDFRVLWIGSTPGLPFPAPGGDPTGKVEAGPATLRYAVTDRTGVSALDMGRAAEGNGFDALERVLQDVLSGASRHGGALLAPFSVRFVVAGEGDLATEVIERLDAQLDLDIVPAGGLVIYRNSRALPAAAVIENEDFAKATRGDDSAVLASLPDVRPAPINPVPGGWDGKSEGTGVVWIGDQFAPGWRLEAGEDVVPAHEAFGWATGFSLQGGGGSFTVRYADQWIRTVQMIVLGLLWLATVWITRKPGRR
ncbi:MAG: glycosyltransferase [Actinomycetota bacterium]